jgi:hypothetical protein
MFIQTLFGGVGMLKGKFVLLTLVAAALVSWQVSVSVDSANSGIIDPCSSGATSGSGCYGSIDPSGGILQAPIQSLADNGVTISCTVKESNGTPIAGIPAVDFWVVGCVGTLTLCGGSGAINATAATDVNGQTTIEGVLFAGVECDTDLSTGSTGTGSTETGLQAVAQGIILGQPNCVTTCLAITPRSPDINGDLTVGLVDFSLFGAHYTVLVASPKPYSACSDYNCDGVNTLPDFAIFGKSYQNATC